MSDFRNQEITFKNAGMEWNTLPEDIPEFKWHSLKNVDINQEGVMECRPHRTSFFGSTYHTPCMPYYDGGGGTYHFLVYPCSYPQLQEVVWYGYVGKTRDNYDAFLSIHRLSSNTDNLPTWPEHDKSDTDAGVFQVFLNGIPLCEERWIYGITTFAQFPPLIVSRVPPSVVRVQSPNGPIIVIIDGRWKVVPSWLQQAGTNAGKYYSPHSSDESPDNYRTLYVTSSTATSLASYPEAPFDGGNVYNHESPSIGAAFVGMQVDPHISSVSTPITMTSTSGGQCTGSYQWRFTFKNGRLGTRSVAGATTSATLTSSWATITGYSPLDPWCDVIELWRKGGDVGDSWRLVSTSTNPDNASAGGYTYPTTYTGQTFSVNDTTSDAAIALNERLDPLLVHPFPTINSAGGSINLLNYQDKTTYPNVVWTGTIPLTCFGPFLGQYVFWIGDPEKPSTFFWNVQGKIDLSSPDLGYNTVSDPAEDLMNGVVFGGQAYIFSRRKLYALDYGGPNAQPEFVPREVHMGIGLAARNALTQNKLGVFFVGNEGLFLTDCSGSFTALSDSIDPIFRGEPVYVSTKQLDSTTLYPAIDWDYANDMRLCATDKNVHFFYKTVVTQTYTGDGWSQTVTYPQYWHLVYDLLGERWLGYEDNASYCYQLENVPNYVVVFNKAYSANLYYEDDSNRESGAAEGDINCHAHTASWNAGIPLTDKCFGTIMLDYDSDGGDVTITPYYNSDTEQGTPITLSGTTYTAGRRVVTASLGDKYAKSISLKLSWKDTTTIHPKFYRMVLLFHPDDEWIKHWHVPATALGSSGWFHVKDSYWCLKSNAAVTLKVTVDGVDYTYTLASTSGVKTKIYQEFKALKGKLFSFTLDSSSDFVFYGEESELNGKSWKTSTGYQRLNPFGAAGYAQYLRTQGGT